MTILNPNEPWFIATPVRVLVTVTDPLSQVSIIHEPFYDVCRQQNMISPFPLSRVNHEQANQLSEKILCEHTIAFKNNTLRNSVQNGQHYVHELRQISLS